MLTLKRQRKENHFKISNKKKILGDLEPMGGGKEYTRDINYGCYHIYILGFGRIASFIGEIHINLKQNFKAIFHRCRQKANLQN